MLACSTLNTASRRQQIESWEASEMNKEVVSPRPADRVNFPIDVQFHAACKNSELDEVKGLLSKGVDIDVANVDGLTVLHQACIDNNYEVVQFLLENKANVNAQDNEGWTPLHACASCSYTELAKLLLEHGADAGIVSFELELPLDVAQGGDMVALLKDWMQRQSIDEKAARSAEEQQMLEDARKWLESGQYPRVVDPRTGATALHIAAAKGYSEVLELLLKLPNVEVDATDVDGWTPLHAAAHWAKEKPLRLLAAAGASFDVITLTNQSIYDVADRSVTMLLRQLRVEQQRAAAAAAEEKPVVTQLAASVQQKSEDDKEKKETSESDSSVDKSADDSSTTKKRFEDDEDDETKPAAPKVPKTVKEEEDRVVKEEKVENATDVEEEESTILTAQLSKMQKDEVALKAEHDKKHVEKKDEVKSVEVKASLPEDTKAEKLTNREGEKGEAKQQEEKKTPTTTIETPGRRKPLLPSSSLLPSKVTPSIKEEEKRRSEEQSTTVKKEAEKSPEDLGSGIPSVKAAPVNQSGQAPEPAATSDGTSVLSGNGPNRRISAVLAPARSEETEAQRSSKARLVRSTRRSTQGIANDVLEEARRLSAAETSTSGHPTAIAAVVAPTPVQNTGKQSSGSDIDEMEPKTMTPTTAATHVSKATITPTQPSSGSTATSSSESTPSSIIAHSRARRAARDRVPTGLLNMSDVMAAAKQLEQSTSAESTPVTSAATDPIPRPTTRVLRSTILNTTPSTSQTSANSNEAVSNGASGDRRVSPATPQLSSSPAPVSAGVKSSNQRYNWRENLDYRLLYEEEKSEKERLKRNLDQISREVVALRNELARLHVFATSGSTSSSTSRYSGGASNADSPSLSSSSSTAALRQASLDFFEDQAKEIDRLRQENARMADENKSLIRVISKLSARTTS